MGRDRFNLRSPLFIVHYVVPVGGDEAESRREFLKKQGMVICSSKSLNKGLIFCRFWYTLVEWSDSYCDITSVPSSPLPSGGFKEKGPAGKRCEGPVFFEKMKR